jgi:hypothetical protein
MASKCESSARSSRAQPLRSSEVVPGPGTPKRVREGRANRIRFAEETARKLRIARRAVWRRKTTQGPRCYSIWYRQARETRCTFRSDAQAAGHFFRHAQQPRARDLNATANASAPHTARAAMSEQKISAEHGSLQLKDTSYFGRTQQGKFYKEHFPVSPIAPRTVRTSCALAGLGVSRTYIHRWIPENDGDHRSVVNAVPIYGRIG